MHRSIGVRRSLLAVVLLAAACTSGPAVSVDPAATITIDNGTDVTVTIEYERPDGSAEPITELTPGGHFVAADLFAGRHGLCRTGRLVARTGDGAEVDELYLVCKGRTWAIEAP